MNKILFIVITLLVFITLIFLGDYVGGSYLLSDQYVTNEALYENIEDENIVSLDDYIEKTKNGEGVIVDNFNDYPIEIQLLQVKSFIIRVFIVIITIILMIISIFIIKSNRIEFTVLMLDNSERGINMVRIALYVVIIMVAFTASQTYPLTYFLGWTMSLMWIITLLVIMIWILNIIYAIKDRKALKQAVLKPTAQ